MPLVGRITPPASRDIEAIADYLAANRGLEMSDRFLTGITAKLSQLTRFPYLGRSRDELALGVRSLSYEQYLIFYQVQGAVVEILRVVSGYQDLEQLFAEEE